MSGKPTKSTGKQYTNITSRPVKTDESGKNISDGDRQLKTDESGKNISDGDRQSQKNKNRPGFGKKFKKNIVYIPPQP